MNENVRDSFLQTLSYALKGELASQPEPEALKDARALSADAISHQVLPLVVDGLLLRAGYRPGAGKEAVLPLRLMELYRNEILRQAQKTADFLLLYKFLTDNGIRPFVMKGIVCRSLYPNPEHRPSADENLLITPDQFRGCHEALLSYGLGLVKEDEDIDSAEEVSYQEEKSHLYIEVHKAPFDSGSKAYGGLNQVFEGIGDRSVIMRIYGTDILTLGFTDHLLYLILHAFKHFLYCGFGIRQVCDILLFSEAYRDAIE